MSMISKIPSVSTVLAVAAAVVAVTATSLGAQQLNPGISCISGDVPAYDYAELTSNYRESIWDSKAAMRLTAETTQLELTVTDTYDSTVCEDTADMKVRCKFRIAAGYSGVFNMRIDNTMNSMSSRYRLCAE